MSYKPYYTGGWQSGESGGTPLTPEALQHFDNGIMSAHRAGQPQNLLDNSYFQYSNSYPTDGAVNQRNTDGGNFVAGDYILDRWQAVDGTITCAYTSDGIRISSDTGAIAQRVKFNRDDIGYTHFTLAAMTEQGLLVASGLLDHVTKFSVVAQAENDEIKIRLCRYADADWRFRVDIFPKEGQEVVLKWVALYRGEYTAETLPEYQPKGYAAELLECQRYFLSVNKDPVGIGYIGNNNVAYLAVPVPVSMRVVPTVVLSGNLKVWSDGKEYDASDVSVYSVGQNSVTLKATVSGATAKKMAGGYVIGTMSLDANM